MHQWVQQKELNNKNEQSVVIIILVATLFFDIFWELWDTTYPVTAMLRFDFYTKNQIGGKIMAYNKTSEERKRQVKKLYFLFI